jgi:TolB-like protein/tetratricopeptide (TPR) repeat protein
MEPIQHQPITGDRTSIAVLPFRNLSRDSDDVYISDGIAEEITSALAVLPGLRVAARESAFSFRDSAEPPAAVAAKLGVAMLLGGSARREGSRVRLAVHLIDPGTGGTIWSEEREIELSDLYAARVEIAQAVAEHLVPSTPTVRGEAPRDPHTASPHGPADISPGVVAAQADAYDLYLRGRFIMGHRAEANLRMALDYFERSVTIDPHFPLAHVGIAQMLALLSFYGHARSHDVMPRAHASVERALRLDDSLGDAHTALAFVRMTYDWDWVGAEREFLRTLDLNPNDLTALLYYGFYYLICIRGRFDQGMSCIWKAVDLDPIAAVPVAMLGVAAQFTRRTENIAVRVREAVEGLPSSWLLQRSMGLVLAAEGRHAEAVAAMERAARLSNRYPWILMDLGAIRADMGDREGALRLHAELERISSERYLQPFALAAIPAALGDLDAALPALRKSFEERDGVLCVLQHYPAFRTVRHDPRFQELVTKMGLG